MTERAYIVRKNHGKKIGSEVAVSLQEKLILVYVFPNYIFYSTLVNIHHSVNAKFVVFSALCYLVAHKSLPAGSRKAKNQTN